MSSEIYIRIAYLQDDLVNQTEVEVGVLKHSPVHAQLQSSSDPMHRQIWSRVKQSRKERYKFKLNINIMGQTVNKSLVIFTLSILIQMAFRLNLCSQMQNKYKIYRCKVISCSRLCLLIRKHVIFAFKVGDIEERISKS